MSYIMGVDIGSTSIKAAVYDFDGRLVSLGTCPNNVVYMDAEHPQWAFWDPAGIWTGVTSAIKQAVSAIEDPRIIQGLAVTGMGMDGLPVDKDGNWLYPFISWQCKRTQPQQELWKENVGGERIFKKSGKQMLAFDTIYRLMWMKENRPEIFSKTDKWLLIEDYVNFLLCGRMATDYSMASSTSVLDQYKRVWSEELINIAEIDRGLFPDIIPSGTIMGRVTHQAALVTGLAEDTPVIMGGHDYHCAALAVGAFMPGTVMDITGTWEMVLAASDEACMSNEIFKAGLALESHVAKDKYSIMGSNVSGDMLEWFRGCYGFEEKLLSNTNNSSDWDILMEKAEKAPCGSKGVLFLPHFCGSASPEIDPCSLGAFIGLDKTVDKGDMLRALIEGLNYQLRDMIEAMENALGQQFYKIVAVGGATRNGFWMQNKADVTGKIIDIPKMEEVTCLGAAMLAGIGTGIYRDEMEAYKRVFKEGHCCYPDKALNNEYNDYFSTYKEIYPSLKHINGDIFRKFKKS